MAKSKTQKKSAKSEEKPNSEKEIKSSNKEIEEKVVDLAKKGMTTEKIGLELKKQGIFIKNSGKKAGQILEAHGLKSNADIINLEKDVERIKKHLSLHKKDFDAKRSLLIKEANLNKLKGINSKKR